MSQPAFFFFNTRDAQTFNFQLISKEKELLLFFNRCHSRNDCIEKISVAAIHAQYNERFEKHNHNDTFSFVLKSGTGIVVGRSPQFTTSLKRDQAITVLQKEIFFANIKEVGLDNMNLVIP